MNIREFATAALFAFLLIGCTAPSTSPDAPNADSGRTIAAGDPATAPKSVASAAADPASDTMERAPGFAPSNLDRSCRTDSDCEVKDVGNCCGAYPMCVNKDASTNPAAVRAQCAKDGIASVCGFREVAGCTCKQGRCEDIARIPGAGSLIGEER
jgi:hypothetical protein